MTNIHQDRKDRRAYQKAYRAAINKRYLAGHGDCMTPSCCRDGRANYNREAMKLSREIKKEREAKL